MDTEPRLARLESRARGWRAACIAACALAAAAAVSAAFTSRSVAAAAQEPATRPAAAGPDGRYQVVVADRELNPVMVLVDTRTGRTWTANAAGGGWQDRGTPPGLAE